MKIDKDRIIYNTDDWIRGLAPLHNTSGNTMYIGQGLAKMTNIDVFPSQLGSVAPGELPVDVTGSTTTTDPAALITSIDYAPANLSYTHAYALTSGATLQEIAVATSALTVDDSVFPFTIAGHTDHTSVSTSTCMLVAYAGKYFFSWRDVTGGTTEWEIGRIAPTASPITSSANIDIDFMTQGATTKATTTDTQNQATLPVPLYSCIQNATLYIGNGRYVHSYDANVGAEGTFYSRVLTLPAEYIVKGFTENGYDLVVFASTAPGTGRKGETAAFFWSADRPADPYRMIKLNDNDVSAPFNYNGTIGCFTYQRREGADTALRIFDGTRFKEVFRYAGNLPGNGGVDIYNGLINWTADGNVYSWGSRDETMPTAGLQVTSGDGTTNGGVLKFLAYPLFSTGVGVTGGLQYLNGNYCDTSSFKTLTAQPQFPMGFKGKVMGVQVKFAGIASGGRSFTLNLLTNEGQTTTTVISALTSVTPSTIQKTYQLDSSGAPLPEFTDIRVDCSWATGDGATSAPAIESITIFYKPITY